MDYRIFQEDGTYYLVKVLSASEFKDEIFMKYDNLTKKSRPTTARLRPKNDERYSYIKNNKIRDWQ